MKKKDDGSAREVEIKYFDEDAITAIIVKVKAEGFVPAEDLKKEFGPEKFTRSIAILYRDLRMFREVRRPWTDGKDALGYEWADRRFSKVETKKIPPELQFVLKFVSPFAAKYSDFQTVIAKCRWTMPVLGAIPMVAENGESVNSFYRNRHGQVLILRYNQRAMITEALQVIGKEQSVARKIVFRTIALTVNGNLSINKAPVNDHGQGKGFCISEKLADGTEFTITADIPTSTLSVAEYLRALRLAGEGKGLSPGRSAGFGDFEILEVVE